MYSLNEWFSTRRKRKRENHENYFLFYLYPQQFNPLSTIHLQKNTSSTSYLYFLKVTYLLTQPDVLLGQELKCRTVVLKLVSSKSNHTITVKFEIIPVRKF